MSESSQKKPWRVLTPEQRERRKQADRRRYAENEQIRARYQNKAREAIKERNEKRKIVRKEKAKEQGRTINPHKTDRKIIEDAIMLGYADERKAIQRMERRTSEEVFKMIATIRALRRYYAMSVEQRRAWSKEKASKVPPERMARYKQEYYRRAKERGVWQEMSRRYAKANREKNKGNPVFRAKENLRCRFRDVMKRYERTGIDGFSSLLGCRKSFLKEWIAKQFKRGMSWDNYGTAWHIDHIVPLASFNMLDKAQIKRAWHYTNLRPLGAVENMTKSDAIITCQPELLLNVA